jgi:hypothetical protein
MHMDAQLEGNPAVDADVDTYRYMSARANSSPKHTCLPALVLRLCCFGAALYIHMYVYIYIYIYIYIYKMALALDPSPGP